MDSCSILLWHINQMIYQRIWKNRTKKRKQTRILSFVTDGKGNPADNLSEVEAILKDMVPNYDPTIWILAKGDAKSIYDIEHNGARLIQDGVNSKSSCYSWIKNKTCGWYCRVKEKVISEEWNKAWPYCKKNTTRQTPKTINNEVLFLSIIAFTIASCAEDSSSPLKKSNRLPFIGHVDVIDIEEDGIKKKTPCSKPLHILIFE